MMKDGDNGGRPVDKVTQDKRQERLKLALRENLKRRKSQARAKGDVTPASPGSDDTVRDGGKS